MIITTPEQMRGAAIAVMKQKCWEDREMKLAGRIETAIRAIPIAPQPVAVTVKPLVWANEEDDYAEVKCFGLTYLLMDPSSSDNTNGWYVFEETTNTTIEANGSPQSAKAAAHADYEARILSALTIHPADPLSDPRVVALVEAAAALLMRLDMENSMRQADFHSDMCQCRRCRMDVLRTALRAIGGEA